MYSVLSGFYVEYLACESLMTVNDADSWLKTVHSHWLSTWLSFKCFVNADEL